MKGVGLRCDASGMHRTTTNKTKTPNNEKELLELTHRKVKKMEIKKKQLTRGVGTRGSGSKVNGVGGRTKRSPKVTPSSKRKRGIRHPSISKRRTPRRQKKVETKVDLFPERVTVLMSPEMRDRVNLLAAKLQRKKSDKSERITANTVLRVAVSVLLSNFKIEDGEAPNTEEELLELAQRKVRKG